MIDDTSTLTRTKPKLTQPSMYTVVFLNDDYTPMDFVVMLLKDLFQMPEPAAINVMLEIHKKGKGNVGRFTYDVACTKVEKTLHLAKQHQHPLQAYPEKLA